MLAEAYPEPKRGMHSQLKFSTEVNKGDLSRARAICKLGHGSKLEHYGRGRSSGVLAFSHRPEPERKAEPVERRHPSERGGSDHREAGAQDGRSERGAAARDFRRRSRATGKMRAA